MSPEWQKDLSISFSILKPFSLQKNIIGKLFAIFKSYGGFKFRCCGWWMQGSFRAVRRRNCNFRWGTIWQRIANSPMRAIMAEYKHWFLTLTAFLVACLHQRGLEVFKWKLCVKAWHIDKAEFIFLVLADLIFWECILDKMLEVVS